MIVRIADNLLRDIADQLEATYPNEGGGFLLGRSARGEIRIVDTIAVDNVFDEAEQYHRYAMRPQDWMRLEDEADERGLTLVGYFHSHPDSPAVPSDYDREHALPNFVYIIAPVYMGRAGEMRAWQLRHDRGAFDELTLEICDDRQCLSDCSVSPAKAT